MIARILLIALLFLLAFSGCSIGDDSTQAVPAKQLSPVDSTSGTAVPLPFDNPFPNRWNTSNDGTNYEPCLAFSNQELARFGIDPKAREDAAIVDGQGIRGCRWLMRDEFAISNLVTNSKSLSEYKNNSPELEWKPNLTVDGRVVGLFDLRDDETSCSTYVQSYAAGVVTNVIVSSDSSARERFNPCKLAVDFTRAYIDKIPE